MQLPPLLVEAFGSTVEMIDVVVGSEEITALIDRKRGTANTVGAPADGATQIKRRLFVASEPGINRKCIHHY